MNGSNIITLLKESDSQVILNEIKEQYKIESFEEEYSKQINDAIEYIKKIKVANPIKDTWLLIYVDRYGVMDFKCYDEKENETTVIDFYSWSQICNLPIRNSHVTNWRQEKFLGLFLWELLFFGFSEKERDDNLGEIFFDLIGHFDPERQYIMKDFLDQIKSFMKKKEKHPIFNRI